MNGSTPTKRRWQFSLYGLFVAMTAAAVGVALVANRPRLAAAIGVCLLIAALLLVADRIVAAGTTPAGARAIVLITIAAWTLVGAALLGIGSFLLLIAYGAATSPLGSAPWLMVAPLAVGGLMCFWAARNASRRGRRVTKPPDW
jgi:hypothetical protein